MNRQVDFDQIKNKLEQFSEFDDDKTIVAEGDSLELLKLIPDQTISLILTDPPYHTTKKKNIQGDTSFKEDEHYLQWMSEFIKEWLRILKPNGSIFCYCSPSMSARLEIAFSKEFNILSQITWTKPNEPGYDGWKQKMKKESLRQWYAHTERIIFAEPSSKGNLFNSYFGNFLKRVRSEAGITAHELTEITGSYGKVNHGGAVSNWEAGRNIPSRHQYEKIRKAILATGKINFFPDYEDAIRPFNVNGSVEFTDVWNFPSVRPYKGKHPAEKPLSMLSHAIKATSFPGDIVLDCFSGSGNTALAALQLNRRSISIDIDHKWVMSSIQKIESLNLIKQNSLEETNENKVKEIREIRTQAALF